MSDIADLQRPIIQLDTQLANQIAAGEVVERPASVVKELLENSLDAGATQIDVEVMNGGKQLIRIRDNGHGIPKDQIALALAPHATSKIRSLADLEALRSFGFRGEALASISSVSKFSLTTKTMNSEQGWRAVAEGQSMAVKVTPAPAREGTRIDVSELFYNTPARRRFLRTDKTEFAQIEAVIKQTALANPTLTLSLKHNQRLVKRFKAAYEIPQVEQRLAQICGKDFVAQSVRVDVDYEQYKLSGWIGLPNYHRSQSDGQYFYVNNRPVKDKVLSHALREAYGPLLPEGRFPAFVLFFELPSEQVDVNVHPTKHEVRFHEVRQVHDFIVQALEQCLQQGINLLSNDAIQDVTDDSKHSLHSGIDTSGTSTQYDSYNQFIATAYRSNLADNKPAKSYHNKDTSMLTIYENDWCLLQHNNQLGMLDLTELFAFVSQSLSSPIKPLRFPALLTVPESDVGQFSQFADELGIELAKNDNSVKLMTAPTSWHDTDLSTLLWDYYCYKHDMPVTDLGWLVSWLAVPEISRELELKYVPMTDIKRLFDESD